MAADHEVTGFGQRQVAERWQVGHQPRAIGQTAGHRRQAKGDGRPHATERSDQPKSDPATCHLRLYLWIGNDGDRAAGSGGKRSAARKGGRENGLAICLPLDAKSLCARKLRHSTRSVWISDSRGLTVRQSTVCPLSRSALDHTITVPPSWPDHSRRVGRIRRVGRASSRGPPECRCLPGCILAAVNCSTTPATSPAPAGRARHRHRARTHNRRWPAQHRVAGRGEVVHPDKVKHPCPELVTDLPGAVFRPVSTTTISSNKPATDEKQLEMMASSCITIIVNEVLALRIEDS